VGGAARRRKESSAASASAPSSGRRDGFIGTERRTGEKMGTFSRV
jgi:hypothetical protein